MLKTHPLLVCSIGTLFIWPFFSDIPYSFAVAINIFLLFYCIWSFHHNHTVLSIGFFLTMVGSILLISEQIWNQAFGVAIMVIGVGLVMTRYKRVIHNEPEQESSAWTSIECDVKNNHKKEKVQD